MSLKLKNKPLNMVITTHMVHKISKTKNSDDKKELPKNSSEIQVLREYLKEFEKSEESKEITF